MQNEIDRTKFIGASEVPAVLGLSPFCTPLQLWAVKTGEVEPDDLSDVEAVEWGTRLERIVSDKFAEKHDVKLIAKKTRYIHPEYSFISCELDNIISGTDELVEIKTVNAFAWKQWENLDELPNHVVLQVMTQLGLSRRSKGWVACLCGGQKYIEKEITFDQELYDTIISRCVEFWKMVQDKTPPIAEANDSSFIVELFPTAGEEIKAASQEMTDAIAMLQQTKAQIIDLEETKKSIEAKVKQVIGESGGIKTPEYTAKWINVKGSTYTVEKKDSRMLRITKNKGA